MSNVGIQDLRGRKLGVILLKLGKITQDQLDDALALQQQQRAPLGRILAELGSVTEDDINEALAAQAGMASLDLDRMDISSEVIALLPSETATSYQVFPLSHDAATNTLTVALKSADNFRAVDDLQLLMGFNVKAVVANSKQLDEYIQKHYGADEESIASLVGDLSDDSAFAALGDADEAVDLDALVKMADDNKVKRLINLVLLQAIRDKASDIHFEPFEHEYKMRYRVDGVLYEMIPPPRQLAWAISSRIKVMSKLDIAERRLPQDGRIELMVHGQPIDMRVSILPTLFGESVVMRVLDRGNVSLDLEKVGMREDDLETFRMLMHKPNGIVIVTGPTGSGKTTTLYSALSEMNRPTEKILTAEDPVEYDIDGLVQVQVNEEAGLTFAKCLRSFLRQDPDVILVGEMRDIETAQIGVQAALTGHLVFSTLHTNDAPSSVARLLDLGMEPFLLIATLEGIVAQRLVRRICTSCRESYAPTEEQLMELQLTPEDVHGRTFCRGKGCEACNQTGYRGRLALFEVMVMDDEIRELIMKAASTNVLREEARKRGMRTLRQAGLLGIYDGITTIEEVVRQTVVED